MSIMETVGWGPMLIGMTVMIGIACWFCARWESRYLAGNFRSSHDQQFANTSRRSYVSHRGLT